MAIKRSKDVEALKQQFMNNVDVDTSLNDLTELSNDQLVDQFVSISQQAALFQGRILSELRTRFGNDDRKFGEYISTTILSDIPSHTRTRLINLAIFFDAERPMDGISLSVAYEISAPKNASKAMDIYSKVVGKKFSVVDVRNMFKKSESNSFSGKGKSDADVRNGVRRKITLLISGFDNKEKISILKELINEIKEAQ